MDLNNPPAKKAADLKPGANKETRPPSAEVGLLHCALTHKPALLFRP
jgi:hypothetical protein